jgi:hypothetical protein
MIITNRLGLPSSIVKAVTNDKYTRGDAHISVTGLIGPARKRALEIQHAAEVTEDASERIWSLMGQIAHGILERADDAGWCEERLFIERHGWRISGQFDRYLLEGNGLLQDYKVTSTYAVKDGSKTEWTAQENIYALMLRSHGYRVERLEVVAILRDWQKSKARHTADYPQVPAIVMPVEMWDGGRTEAYIVERLQAHGHAQHGLPECSPEERWERPAKFALYKAGNVRATKLFDDATAAEVARLEFAAKAKKNDTFEIRQRPAEQVRCESYCPVLKFCSQGQKLLAATDPVSGLGALRAFAA